MRDRLVAAEVWKVMGLPVQECVDLALASPMMQEYRRLLFMRIVPNIERLGSLTPWLPERFAELGILHFEHEPPDA